MTQSSTSTSGELKSALWMFRQEFIICAVFSALVNLLMLTPTMYMLQLFDRVMISQNTLTLAGITLVTLFFFSVMAFSEWSRSRLLVRLGIKMDLDMSPRIFGASFATALRQGGQQASRALTDFTSIRQFVTGSGLFAFLDAPWTPIYIAVLFLLHPILGVMGILFSLMLIIITWISNRLTQKPVEGSVEAAQNTQGFIISKLRNSEVIEAMGMLGSLEQRWQEKHADHLTQSSKSADLSTRIRTFTKFVRYTQQSLALGAGAYLVIRGELTPGAMIAANVLMTRATQPIDLMIGAWRPFLEARKAYRRLEILLTEHPAASGKSIHAPPLGQITLRQLSANAPDRQQPILDDISVELQAGQVIGIIGPSGSGKSTLGRAIIGIWPDTNGDVLLDGNTLGSWQREALGPHIGFLPQDVELFEGSIAENIARFGEVDADKVISAAKRAGVHDMILRFPNGYDTAIGDSGGQLSGGQRQRIALARALYGTPRLVVLDEPNSNLDDAGEAALLAAINDLRTNGSTVFIITHRPGPLAAVDQLLVIEKGHVAHRGPRADVMAALKAKSSLSTPASGSAQQQPA